jgi:ubiquinone/menaquinone biosynthesis C-methylase UbiE
VNHDDHVALIRDGVRGAPGRWLELGAGEGAFTLALADILVRDGTIVALDRDAVVLERLAARMTARFPHTPFETVVADFTVTLPAGPFAGVLAANSLHFVSDLAPVLATVRSRLSPGGRLVIVEYDADRGNPWVPHPFSFRTWRRVAVDAGFGEPTLLHRVPSRFLGAIYGAATAPATGNGAADRTETPTRAGRLDTLR